MAEPVGLFMDPGDAEHLVIAPTGSELFESVDGGESWSMLLAAPEPLNGDFDFSRGTSISRRRAQACSRRICGDRTEVGLPTHEVSAIAYSPVHEAILAGTRHGGLFVQAVGTTGIDDADDFRASPLVLSVEPNPTCSRVRFRLGSNPALGSTGAEMDGGPSRPLTIRDVRGRLVRRLGLVESRDGVEAIWDTRDEPGRRVAAGVYFAEVTLGGRRITGTVLVTR
ncbi:MAG: hypothetical protein R3E12_14245 [Candidatus Eisenbacteria bacterium]